MRTLVCVAVAAILFAKPVSAELCNAAQVGTYLSNVCWLIETHANGRIYIYERSIVEADEENCTVTLARKNESDDSIIIHFNRANVRDSETRVDDGKNCLYLRGKQLVKEKGGYAGYVKFCGYKSIERVEAAAVNLYTKYCTGWESEF